MCIYIYICIHIYIYIYRDILGRVRRGLHLVARGGRRVEQLELDLLDVRCLLLLVVVVVEVLSLLLVVVVE